jgi:class 3 adenylate cyclase
MAFLHDQDPKPTGAPACLIREVPLAQYSLDSSVRLHETCYDSTGTPQMDVSTWLRDLGLEHYAEAFRANDIDAGVLSRLTAEDLVALGVTSIGHRRKLLDAIAVLEKGRPPAAIVRPVLAERRQLTLLFCDLVGSTELAARLDPEDLREVMQAYLAVCTDVIGRFEGCVVRFLGDGVLAHFGWPRAHEDDAERAVHAGLQLVREVAQLEPRAGVRLQARVGVATGHVVVGESISEGISGSEAASGDTPNLAARLQALAAPGSIVISASTRRLVGGVFELSDLGPQRLKGFAEPLGAWQVTGERRAEGRFEALHAAGLTPLVGREKELALLLRLWRQASAGEGQVALLSGEPGIGKSRLVRELRERIGAEPHVRVTHQCSPYYRTSPLHPVIQHLERAAGFEREDLPEARLAKLEALLARGTDKLDQAVPLIAALLGIPTGGRYTRIDLTPQRQKELTLEALLEQLVALAAEQPVLVVHEDVHWIDPTTQELLSLALERTQRLPVLTIITFRPEFTPPWAGQLHVRKLELDRLGRREGAAMVDRLVGHKTLPDEVAAQIVAKTDGVPLFVEELTKAVLESGLLADVGDHYELSGPLPRLAIPATLHDSLLARLDHLAPAKEVAQIGAAIGRQFSHALLVAVADRPEPELHAALDQLVHSGLIFRRGAPPGATYCFKHALVRDAAYESILKSRRRILHGRIAALLQHSSATAPDLLAQHLAGAGMAAAAARAYARAAQANIARGAGREAITQVAVALRLLENEPQDDERGRLEAELLVARGDAMRLVQGTAAPETGAVYRRARELIEQLRTRRHRGRVPSSALSKALYGECLYHYHRAELRDANALALRLLETSAREGDAISRELGLEMAALTSFSLGALASARGYFEQFTAPPKSNCPPDPVISRRASSADIYLACTMVLLGYPAQARERAEHAIAAAEQTREPFALALCVGTSLYLFEMLRDRVRVRQSAERLRAAAEAAYMPHWASMADWFLALATLNEADVEGSISRMRAGIRTSLDQGCMLEIPFYLALLADALLAFGRAGEARVTIGEALERSHRTAERWVEPELYRRRAQLRVAAPSKELAGAIGDLVRALEAARAMKARLWELRAARDLARLWAEQGRRQKAYDLLAPVYGWFTEGFDTADLKDAKALLDQLA